MNKNELKELFDDFCKNKKFMLNPDKEIVDRLLDGVLDNENKSGLKYCPCRLTSGDFEKDLGLICPCNFFVHDTWSSKEMCLCGLFMKRKT